MILLFGSLQALWYGAIERPGQAIFGIVSDIERVIEISGFDDGQHGPKDFLLGDASVRVHIGENGWLNEVARTAMFAANSQAALVFADLDILKNFLHCILINNRTHIGGWLRDITHCQAFRLLDDLLQDLIVDLIHDNSARAGGTLLALEAEGRGDDTCSSRL